jgi:predicted TIM-barrel fold metal-dependent hydrolase
MSSSSNWSIIDVHTHIRPPWWKPLQHHVPEQTPAEEAQSRERFRKITDVNALVDESVKGDVQLRLLSATIEGIFGVEGPTDIEEIQKTNNYLADVQRQHHGQLAALATVDAFSGDTGAAEAERAVKELNHAGIVIDSSRDQQFLNAKPVRSTLEVAAALKVPVLVHPVGAPNSDALRKGGGTPAYSFGRGLINGAAFFSVLKSGILEELPDLNLIFTAIGVGALVIAAAEAEYYSADRIAKGFKPNIYFDIMGLNVPTIRYLVDFLGAERVVVGTDWPIWAPVSREALTKAFSDAGLTPEQQHLVASSNAARLLGQRAN